MKLILETTPTDDATLQALSDAAMVGQGGAQQPTLEDFGAALLRADMDQRNKEVKSSVREDLKRIIETADDVKLAAILAASK